MVHRVFQFVSNGVGNVWFPQMICLHLTGVLVAKKSRQGKVYTQQPCQRVLNVSLPLTGWWNRNRLTIQRWLCRAVPWRDATLGRTDGGEGLGLGLCAHCTCNNTNNDNNNSNSKQATMTTTATATTTATTITTEQYQQKQQATPKQHGTPTTKKQ